MGRWCKRSPTDALAPHVSILLDTEQPIHPYTVISDPNDVWLDGPEVGSVEANDVEVAELTESMSFSRPQMGL